MTKAQYIALMETLDATIDNGYDEALTKEPAEIVAEILEETGDRTWEDVPSEELYTAIRKWQERHQ